MPRVLTPPRNRVHFLALLAALTLFLPQLRADQAKGSNEPKDPKPPIVIPEAFTKTAPEGIDDLKAMEAHVKALVQKVMPCTVCVRVGNASGSAVIVTDDGVLLTAAHVVAKPDQDVEVILSDGQKVKGKTLGMNSTIDSGMMKITDPPPKGFRSETDKNKWLFVDMGESAKLAKGQWVLTLGHPGGYQKDRTPPVRLGRVLENSPKVIRTDCTVFSGDSGGPLFDMEGKVVGIHSKIALDLTINWHVPVDTFRDTWDRLVKGEKWGGTQVADNTPPDNTWLGVQTDGTTNDECRINKVVEKSPAETAGFKTGDVVTKFGGKKVETLGDLQILVNRKKPGDKVEVEVTRDGKTVTLNVTLAEKPSNK